MPDTPLVDVSGLTKTFGAGTSQSLTVLDNLDLQVEPGAIVAVMGESGSGKSTLLHILGGLDRPTGGTVHIGGRNVFAMDDETLSTFRNQTIGFVFQFHHLLPEFSALENVTMPARIQGQSLSAANTRARSLLDLLGLADRADQSPSTLSGGEKQRVAVARALMNEPDLVLLDEPTGNLDARTAAPIHDEIETLRRETGQTFVLVTHTPSLASIADHVFRLEHGQLHPASLNEHAA
jgi:lipoprotein-releasing system ATP-binding protein